LNFDLCHPFSQKPSALAIAEASDKGNLMSTKITKTKTKILRRHEVEDIVGLSRSTLYSMMADATFPKPIKLGKRAVGWRDGDIDEWLESRATTAT
jgi:prophage regulatory protein